jgi:hypothetical protein
MKIETISAKATRNSFDQCLKVECNQELRRDRKKEDIRTIIIKIFAVRKESETKKNRSKMIGSLISSVSTKYMQRLLPSNENYKYI